MLAGVYQVSDVKTATRLLTDLISPSAQGLRLDNGPELTTHVLSTCGTPFMSADGLAQERRLLGSIGDIPPAEFEAQ